jgi:CheY-like chemotaxis protein
MTPKILIVDDDPLMRRLLRHYLLRAGYQLTEATSGLEGLKAAFCELPQLVILDVMMEEMDGLAVVRELRRIPVTRSMPIIVITSNLKAHDVFRQECAVFGVAAFLTKPVGEKQLLAEVKRLTDAIDTDKPS